MRRLSRPEGPIANWGRASSYREVTWTWKRETGRILSLPTSHPARRIDPDVNHGRGDALGMGRSDAAVDAFAVCRKRDRCKVSSSAGIRHANDMHVLARYFRIKFLGQHSAPSPVSPHLISSLTNGRVTKGRFAPLLPLKHIRHHEGVLPASGCSRSSCASQVRVVGWGNRSHQPLPRSPSRSRKGTFASFTTV